MLKIALIGAGSVVFAEDPIADILAYDALKNCRIHLVDPDPRRLAVAAAMARSINRVRGAGARIAASRTRQAAIDGADVVITTFGVGGFPATRTDLELPARFGVKQTIGDTLNVGGIFRSFRSLPVLMDVCRDIEQSAPGALLINYVNPMAMHCLAVQRGTRVRSVGLCHGVRYTRGRLILLARLAQMSPAAVRKLMNSWDPSEAGGSAFMDFYRECRLDTEYRTLCAGINHMAAFLRFEKNCRDQYPWVRRALERPVIRQIEPVRLELFERFGYFMTETSGHIAEYLPWFMPRPAEIKRLAIRPNTYLATCRRQNATFEGYARKARAGGEFITAGQPPSIENAPPILNAIATNQPFEFNGNVANDGGRLIPNLPADACVEVPCVADGMGVHPLAVGDLPPQIAAMIRTNVNVQDLVVRAVLEERKEHVYHAAYLDPNLAASLPLPPIKALVDAMIAAHGRMMPVFMR
ncbi:MAG: alpha-glucosidase/alpha-galactosidase [Planctomycetota bacterium]